MLISKVAHGASFSDVLDLTQIAIVHHVFDGFQLLDRRRRPDDPESLGALIVVETHPRSLQFLTGSHSRRSVVGLGFWKQHIVSSPIAAGGTLIQEIEITLLWTRQVNAKLPAVFEDFLT